MSTVPVLPLKVRRGRALEAVTAALLALTIALVFWGGQRYPSLLKKLHAGQGLRVAGAISFDALLPVRPEMPIPERVGRTAVNWLWTNRFGMYFALPFGAAVMTLLALSDRPKGFASTAANVACGALAGMPAGVCTNCATPIGQSLLVGGTSTRLTVAAMISSPMLNPVVVTMAFFLFPLKLAVLRLLVPLALLAMLPLLVKERARTGLGLRLEEEAGPLGPRIAAVTKSFFRNLLRLTWMTLPWMLLAALTGALAAEVIPAYGTRLPVSALGVITVALFGTLLPVPMALDVGLAWVLFHAGVPVCYVAALLCTLGPVSMYSLSALGKLLGRDVPVRLAGATAVLGSLAGLFVLWTT